MPHLPETSNSLLSRAAFAARHLPAMALALTVTLAGLGAAHATSGRKIISANTTLTADHAGQIKFNANNITLDCQHHKITFTAANTDGCGAGGTLKCGIHVANRSGIKIKNCEVTGAFNYGVWLSGVTGTSTVENTTARGTGVGFRIDASKNLTLTSSSAVTCTGGGFELRTSESVSMFACSAFDNAGDGIDVNDSLLVNIQTATVLHNGVNGIELDGGTQATIGSSMIQYNGKHGISLDPSENNKATYPCTGFKIWANDVEGNAQDGIRIQDCDNGSIRNNDAIFNILCDGNQDALSTGNSWNGNNLTDWCGTVPNPH